MNSSKQFQLLVTSVVALVSTITVPCSRAQECKQHPQDCDAKQILSDFSLFNVMDLSFPEPFVYCDTYERTWLSEDGTKAQYNLVYTNAGDTTPIKDTCTYEAVNSTLIYISCAEYASGTVYHFILDYINGNNCLVGHASFTAGSGVEYYILFDNPNSDTSEYRKCLDKIYRYSGGQVVSMRDEEKCVNITPNPY